MWSYYETLFIFLTTVMIIILVMVDKQHDEDNGSIWKHDNEDDDTLAST